MKGDFTKLRKGFTLVEMVVVIAIIGVLAAIIIPSLFNYIHKAQRRVDTSNAKQIYMVVNGVLLDAAMGEIDQTDKYAGLKYASDTEDSFYRNASSKKKVKVWSGGSMDPEQYGVMIVAKLDGTKPKASHKCPEWEPGNDERRLFCEILNERMFHGEDHSFVSDSGAYQLPLKYLDHKDNVNTDRWFICWRKDDRRVEIWTGDSKGAGGCGLRYRVWPDPCDEYNNSYYENYNQKANTLDAWGW